jgi:preprotein translocase subunit SecG
MTEHEDLVGVDLCQAAAQFQCFGGIVHHFGVVVVRTTDFVEKATWSLAIFICVLSIASAFVTSPTMVTKAPQIKSLPTTEKQAPNFGTETPAQGETPAAAPAQTPAAPAK